MINTIGHPVAYEEGSPYYSAETAHEGLWVDPPLLLGYEPVDWRVIDEDINQAIIRALKRCFSGNVDGPLDPETFLRLHRKIKQAAYRRMFFIDITKAEMPYKSPGPGGWKWWSTKRGREGRKIIRRKIKFYTMIFGSDWVYSKCRDFAWLFLLLPLVGSAGWWFLVKKVFLH